MGNMLFENLDLVRAIKILRSSEKIIVACSGGRDSVLSAFWAVEEFGKYKCDLVYSDTGVEFPDMMPYLMDFSRFLGVPLKVLRGKTFFEAYAPTKTFPAPRSRNCMQELVFSPIDNYAVGLNCSFSLITGSHGGQRETTSSTKAFMEKTVKKTTFDIVNPLYFLNRESIRKSFEKQFYYWGGYKLGFNRSACWCCPFQRPAQYDTLKKYYPVLYLQLMDMAKTWRSWDSDLERYYRKQLGLFASGG